MNVAGFDIGGTNARMTVYDDAFNVVGETRQRIRGATGPNQIAQVMIEMIDAVEAPVEAVGIGLAGQLTLDGRTVVNAPNLDWRDVPFAALAEEALGGVPVKVVNDLSALVWGEFQAGAVEDVQDVLAVYVGTGVGGALVSDGILVNGSGGKAGEIGHCKVVVGGRLCGCGERGCVEAYAGGVHLEQQVRTLADVHGFEVGESADVIDLAVADALSREIEELSELWTQATDYLAITLANACTLLNPAVLLLGGGILANLPHFRELTLQKVSPLVLQAARMDLEIRFPSLGEDAGVLGAALLARDALA